MKYIVMECHEGYAVLMDEDARFVKAADLHYEVGQTVTDPIIMNEGSRSGKIAFSAGKFIAAAACLVLFASAGAVYYSHNLKTQSTVVISSEVDIRMYANKKGRVIRIVSDSPSGQELLRDYSVKGKDTLTAANEIIGLQLEKGYISNGDTVDFYVSSDDSSDCEALRSDLENTVSEVKVKVHGAGGEEKPAKPDAVEKKPEPPKPDKEKAPEKTAPDKEKPVPPHTETEPPAPGAPPASKVEPPKKDDKADAPTPPAEPKAPGKHDQNEHDDVKKPEPPKPPLPGEKEPAPPEHEHHEELSAEIETDQQFTLAERRPTALQPRPGNNDDPAESRNDPPQPPPVP